MKLSEPWYSYVKSGKKKIEGRIFDEKRKILKIGEEIIFTNESGEKPFKKKIIGLMLFKNFDMAIHSVKLKDILPNIKTYKQGIKLYKQIPGYSEGEKQHGVILIYLN